MYGGKNSSLRQFGCLVTKSMSDSLRLPLTLTCQTPLSMEFPQTNLLEQVAILFQGILSQFRDRTRSPYWQEDFFYFFFVREPPAGSLYKVQYYPQFQIFTKGPLGVGGGTTVFTN